MLHLNNITTLYSKQLPVILFILLCSLWLTDYIKLPPPILADIPITVVTTGDVMVGRFVNFKASQSGQFTLPFEKTADFLNKADIAFINLESPLVKNCPITTQGMTFCGDVRHSQGLQVAGIDIVNMANNHAANYGLHGITDTVQTLKKIGIQTVGLGNVEIKNVRGVRFAFLGYNDVGKQTGIASAEHDTIIADIHKAKTLADVVFVAFHWGQEYTDMPTVRQKQLAHLAIDAGADVIVGNHPHWVQPMERYRDKIIIYSHGNFVFDQFWSEKNQQGIVGKFTFSNKSLIDVELIPVRINHLGQPTMAFQ